MLVEHDAGAQAQFLNEDYEKAGATLVSREDILKTSDILLKVRPPLLGKEAEYVRDGSTLISFIYPRQNKEIVEALSQRGVNALAMDMIPRISRAQTFDALRYAPRSYYCVWLCSKRWRFSSMANIAGYKAVLEASNHFGRYMTGQVTAAGYAHSSLCFQGLY